MFLRWTYQHPWGLAMFLHLFHVEFSHFCDHFYNWKVSALIHLISLLIHLLPSVPTGAGLLPCLSWKILCLLVKIVAFDYYLTSLRTLLFLTGNRLQSMPNNQFNSHVLLPFFSMLSLTTTQVCPLSPVVSLLLVDCPSQIYTALFTVAWSILSCLVSAVQFLFLKSWIWYC